MSHHLFGSGRPLAGEPAGDSSTQPAIFRPLPKPTGTPPFHLDLKDILPADKYAQISSTKEMSLHCAGDTGGVKMPADQVIVANHMETQFNDTRASSVPAFFYILGDVVYYYGQAADYYSEFYDPYAFYHAPIFAIPGNHDGDIDPNDPGKPASLDAFVKFFCSKKAKVPPESGDAPRTTMIQPNVYWTLVTPVANIIGLYTNVPPGGVVKDDQKKWLIKELVNAEKEREQKAIIITLHHPPYSMDRNHGSSTSMQKLLEEAFTKSGVLPDLVLSGHVHNYQRFTKKVLSKQLPYIVAGSGGYWFLHSINTGSQPIQTPVATPFKDVTFEKYCDDRHGFMRIKINMVSKRLVLEYFTVPRTHESWKADAVLFDTITIDLQNNSLL